METRQRKRPPKQRERSASKRGFQSAAQVVYTEGRPFNKKRLFLHLGGIVAIVLALIFGLSIFFKVDKVCVSGVDSHMQHAVYEACGIREGDNLLGISKAKVSGRILQALPYVDSVQVRIKLPDTVNIEVTAVDITYAMEDTNGALWKVSASGRVVAALEPQNAGRYTRITGVLLDAPQVGSWASAYEPELDQTGTEPTDLTAILASDRLEAALRIAKATEEVGMLENVDSIDASILSELKMYYDDRLEIWLGDNTNLVSKVAAVKSAVAQLDGSDVGTLDVSYRIRPSDVIFTRHVTES